MTIMNIKVASTNPQKIQAVKDLAPEYEVLKDAHIEGMSVPSGVSEQPKTIDETVLGAMNRSKNAFVDCDLSFGIESGLMVIPGTKAGVMDVCVCAVYDGKQHHLGLSSAFDIPEKIMQLMEGGMTMQDACYKAGITENKNLGSSEGLIGILTKGRVSRLTYTKQAVMAAMIHLENEELF
jgi:inosine/xanthosine triphosphatase